MANSGSLDLKNNTNPIKKICLIGNSHLAALKQGWDLISEKHKESFELTFFGAIGTRLTAATLKFADGQLYSTNHHINNS